MAAIGIPQLATSGSYHTSLVTVIKQINLLGPQKCYSKQDVFTITTCLSMPRPT